MGCDFWIAIPRSGGPCPFLVTWLLMCQVKMLIFYFLVGEKCTPTYCELRNSLKLSVLLSKEAYYTPVLAFWGSHPFLVKWLPLCRIKMLKFFLFWQESTYCTQPILNNNEKSIINIIILIKQNITDNLLCNTLFKNIYNRY